MTDQELRIAIALHVGEIEDIGDGLYLTRRPHAHIWNADSIYHYNQTSKFTTSLNAILPLVRGLDDYRGYLGKLAYAVDPDCQISCEALDFARVTATARQHAEAYAKTKGII